MYKCSNVLVFYRLHNEPAAHYESAGTRLFYLGRTETIRSCSIESVQFAKAVLDSGSSNEDKKQALLAAVNSHKDYATQVKMEILIVSDACIMIIY
jgi:carnitine O-acetyltransferase